MLTIQDNIALGAAPVATVDKSSGKRVWELPEVSDEDVIAAARMADAHDFISRLPGGYDTMLGERGALLRGGQRQRLCIARALVRNPAIIVLDEATAALDANSERVAQDALERAAAGRTTITIAHRLSTIHDADRISVLENGAVVEAGTHDELLEIEAGWYQALVEPQNITGRAADDGFGKDDKSSLEEEPELAKRRSAHISLSKKDSTTQILGELADEEKARKVDSGVLRRTFALIAKEWIFILAGIVWMTWTLTTIPLVKLTELMMIGSYFEKSDNSVGALTTRLSREAALGKGVTGDTLGAVTSVISSLASGLIIGFVYCWRVALVVLAIIPGVVIGGYL